MDLVFSAITHIPMSETRRWTIGKFLRHWQELDAVVRATNPLASDAGGSPASDGMTVTDPAAIKAVLRAHNVGSKG